ncbi:MAG: hypothetical protein WA919_08290 [Coleofasciculaceae cyanobacterium]
MPRQRGVPFDRDELKERTAFSVTPSALKGLDQLVEENGCKSRSDLVEKIGRREIPIGGIQLPPEDSEALGKP